MKNKKENCLSKKFWFFVLGICTILIVTVTICFVLFCNRKKEVIEKTERGANVTLNYTGNSDSYSIVNVVPTTDVVAMVDVNEGNYLDFSVDVDFDKALSVEYEISAMKNSSMSTISDDDIRIYLERENSGTYDKVFGPKSFVGLKKVSDFGSEKGSMVLANVKKKKSGTDNYRLRMWLSDTSLLSNGNYSVKIVVKGKAN